MPRSTDASSGDAQETGGDEAGQVTLDEFTNSVADDGQCEAYADSTSERCEHDALPGVPYCADHFHLLDDADVDSIRMV